MLNKVLKSDGCVGKSGHIIKAVVDSNFVKGKHGFEMSKQIFITLDSAISGCHTAKCPENSFCFP